MKAIKMQKAKRQKRRRRQVSLEQIYRTMFTAPMVQPPARERLTMYKSVPSVTTYGVYEKPI